MKISHEELDKKQRSDKRNFGMSQHVTEIERGVIFNHLSNYPKKHPYNY